MLPPGAIGKAIVVFDYAGKSTGELTMRRGDIIWIYDKLAHNPAYTGWWLGTLSPPSSSIPQQSGSENAITSTYGRKALFPKDYVNEMKMYKIDVTKVNPSIVEKQMAAGLLKPNKENVSNNKISETKPQRKEDLQTTNKRESSGLLLVPNQKKIGLSVSSSNLLEAISNKSPEPPINSPSQQVESDKKSGGLTIPSMSQNSATSAPTSPTSSPRPKNEEHPKLQIPTSQHLTHLQSAPLPKYNNYETSNNEYNITDSNSQRSTDTGSQLSTDNSSQLSTDNSSQLSIDNSSQSKESLPMVVSQYDENDKESIDTRSDLTQPLLFSPNSDPLLDDAPLPQDSQKNRTCECVIL